MAAAAAPAASSSSSSGWTVLAAVAVLLAVAHAGDMKNPLKNPANDECKTSSFPELCVRMVASVEYKTDYDLALGVFMQARQHITSAQEDIERAKANAGGDQSRLSFLEVCRQEYELALREMETCIDRFTNTIDPLTRDMFVYSLSNSTTHVYHCILNHQQYEKLFPLDSFAVELSKFMFNSYDLGTRNTYQDADMMNSISNN